MQDSSEEMVAVLSKLDEDALFALARTVTQGLKKSTNREEAFQNIIKYSPNELSILRRKVITKDILFSYLEDNNVKVNLPTTKNELIDKIAEIWNLSRVAVHSQENGNLENNSGCPNTQVKTQNYEDHSISHMAEQFAKWFYAMLNNNECGPEHFFDDAKLTLHMYVNDNCDTTVVENDSEELKNTLLKIRSEHNLFFNPNASKDGVQGRVDPHGLVMVLTCGTLHIQNICAGVFEQVFALARDPFSDNNWKVKSTELNLRSKGNVLETPRLCDSELTAELLMLPED